MAEVNTTELPKLDENVQTELTKQHALNHVDTVEKNKLPTKEDVEVERQQVQLKQGIENFRPDTLRQVSTDEKIV
uniref:Thymosin beta n=1 Tax=Panagrolaimus sp. PS1159 TaxID=55785 RepID=A0AC35G7C9_9BILA